MPLQIRIPEEIFKSDPKDIFLIEFADPEGEISPLNGFPYIFESDAEEAAYDPENPPGRAELLAWFAEYLPDVTIEALAPPANSGFVCGGVNGRLRVDFDEASLQVWCEHWEDENGDGIDPRFACFRLPYHVLDNENE